MEEREKLRQAEAEAGQHVAAHHGFVAQGPEIAAVIGLASDWLTSDALPAAADLRVFAVVQLLPGPA